jgi:hypothetical protein
MTQYINTSFVTEPEHNTFIINYYCCSVEKLMHVGKFKNLQHTTNIPIHLAYIRITESETVAERTRVYPGKPSWGRKPSQNFSLDSSTKYNNSTRL